MSPSVSYPPKYEELDEADMAAGMDKHMMTGDACCDKAIMEGKNPSPPNTNYDEEYSEGE
jgi:hypothetical protein